MVAASLFGKVELTMLNMNEHRSAVAGVLFLVAIGGIFWATMGIYSSWYLLDCLYADRKDRSVLFFKSMPISDLATVLSKLFVGIVAIPLVYFAAADASALLMAFVISVRARLLFGSSLWRPELWMQQQVLWLYLMATSTLWYLPMVGWLHARLGVGEARGDPAGHSAAARHHAHRTAFPEDSLRDPAAARSAPRRQLCRASPSDPLVALRGEMTPGVWQLPDPLGFLSSMDVWIGVLVGVLFIAGAVQLRMRRADGNTLLLPPKAVQNSAPGKPRRALNVQDQDRPVGEDAPQRHPHVE